MKTRQEFKILLAKAGKTHKEVAEYFSVPVSTIQYMFANRTQTVSIRGGNYLRLRDIVEWLKGEV